MLTTADFACSPFFVGITTLASLIQVNSGFAAEPAYQRIVLDCLDNPDETLKRKVYNLEIHFFFVKLTRPGGSLVRFVVWRPVVLFLVSH